MVNSNQTQIEHFLMLPEAQAIGELTDNGSENQYYVLKTVNTEICIFCVKILKRQAN